LGGNRLPLWEGEKRKGEKQGRCGPGRKKVQCLGEEPKGVFSAFPPKMSAAASEGFSPGKEEKKKKGRLFLSENSSSTRLREKKEKKAHVS